MSAIHYMSSNSKFRLTPNRPLNAAAEIKMILAASGADGLGTVILDRLQATVEWLEGEVATQITEVIASAKAQAASKKATTKAWPSVDEVAKMTAKELGEFAGSRDIDISGASTKVKRVAVIEAARPVEAPAAEVEAPKAPAKGKAKAEKAA